MLHPELLVASGPFRDSWLSTMASRFSRALGVLRRAQRSHGSHGAIVPLGARPHLNALAAAGIVLGSSLVSCKEKTKATKATKVEVKDCRRLEIGAGKSADEKPDLGAMKG